MDKIEVLIIDDDINWLKRITSFLNKNDDINVTGTAATKEKAIELVKILDVDVILLDINLTDDNYDGISIAMEILEIKKVKIIMLTGLTIEELITQSFAAGAVNYFSKANFKKLPDAIRDTYHNKAPIEVLLKDYIRLKKDEQLKDLTSAEKEVFQYLERGYTQPKIAKALNKSESTIKSQVSSILEKLNVPNSKEAVNKVKQKIF